MASVLRRCCEDGRREGGEDGGKAPVQSPLHPLGALERRCQPSGGEDEPLSSPLPQVGHDEIHVCKQFVFVVCFMFLNILSCFVFICVLAPRPHSFHGELHRPWLAKAQHKSTKISPGDRF